MGVGGGGFAKFGLLAPYANQDDLGRFDVTKDPKDRYVFKVPILRNVTETYPYFHDGAVWTLQEAIQTTGRLQLGIELSPQETRSIATFLGSLTGEVPIEARTLPKLPPIGPDTPRPQS